MTPQPRDNLAGLHVLVVEDEFLLADEMRRELEAAGAHVLGPTPGVADALELLETSTRVDAAILDVNLGGDRVFAVADALRARAVPFVFSTGYDAWALPPAYRDAPRVEKPLDMGQVTRALFGPATVAPSLRMLRTPGEGSSVDREPRATGDTEGEPVQHANITGLRLLLVEDEYLLALYLSEMLEDMGAEVLGPVASVADALDLIDKAPEIDAAILDVNLAGEAVFPVADKLRARHVPFAFASGYDPDLMPLRFRDIDVCQKPIDVAAVRDALARLRPAA